MKFRTLHIAVVAACAFSAAHAQTVVVPGNAIETLTDRAIVIASADAARDSKAFAYMFADKLGRGPVVKNAPYSAETISESVQNLPDGNVIAKKTVGMVYRDAQGRVRQETGTGDARSVFISDPAADASYNLPAGSKHAMRLPRTTTIEREGDKSTIITRSKDGKEVRIENGKVFVNGKEVGDGAMVAKEMKLAGKDIRVENGKVFIDGVEMKPGDGRKVVVKTIGEPGEGDGARREEVRVQVVHSGDLGALQPPLPPLPPLPPGAPMNFNWEMKSAGKAVVTPLGSKDIEGVRADGKKSVRTIPAGEIGNKNPIDIVTETWFSPDLQVTVLTKTSDPRSGETSYKLANIKRGEPPAELFKAPADVDAKVRK